MGSRRRAINPLITAAAIAANHSRLLDAYALLRRKLGKSQVAILMYHRIGPKKDKWYAVEPLGTEKFEKQMEYFCRNYEILTLDGLAQYIEQDKALPKKAVAITFDDGYKDNYLYAYPILTKHRMPATIFLTTGHIGTGELFWFDKVGYAIHHANTDQLELDELGAYALQSEFDKACARIRIAERLNKLPEEKKNLLTQKLLNLCQANIPANLGQEHILSWDEVREMHNKGISFGAHSVTHPILTNLPLQQARTEIMQSKKDIEEKLGQAVTTFAYPYGNYNAKIIALLREIGFTCAVTTEAKLISPSANPYKLGRIGAVHDFNKFKVVFSGLYHDLRSNKLFQSAGYRI